MNQRQLRFLVLSFSAMSVLVAGCGSGGSSNSPQNDENKDPQGKNEAHVDEHGPHGGQLIRLEPANYTAEWDRNDEAKSVTIIILDKDAKTEVPVPIDSVAIESDIGSKIEYPLEAVSPSGDDPPKASRFHSTQQELFTALKLTEGDEEAKALLILTIDGQTYRGKIEHHEHGHKN